MIFEYLLITFFFKSKLFWVYNKQGKQYINISFGNTLTLKTLSAFQFSLQYRKEGFLTYFKTHIYFACLGTVHFLRERGRWWDLGGGGTRKKLA